MSIEGYTVRHDIRYWEAKKVTMIGALINALLGIVKLIGGAFSHSHALIADGFHSLSDLLTDGMVLFASKYGSLEADDTHPYGHQRIETAATLMLSLLLGVAGAGIAWDAIDELLNQSHTAPTLWALPIAVLSIIANELSFQYTKYVGQKIQSDLILANAWHHRSDAASSVVVTLGLIASFMGYIAFDAGAAVIVGFLIIKMGWDYGWNSIKELIDTAVDNRTLEKIENIIKNVPGVIRIHQLRSRFMGGEILIDVHVLVSPTISVSEGHYIAQHVHHELVSELEKVRDVVVHVDPEDDELTQPCLHLPNREYIDKHLIRPWQQAFPFIDKWTIHYLDGCLYVDLFLTEDGKKAQALKAYVENDAQQRSYPLKVSCAVCV